MTPIKAGVPTCKQVAPTGGRYLSERFRADLNDADDTDDHCRYGHQEKLREIGQHDAQHAA